MKKRKILILNGPNLNMLDKRDPKIYGTDTLEKAKSNCTLLAKELDLEIEFKQSNFEGEIVEQIQEAIGKVNGIIINAAAYTHTSIAIRDSLEMFKGAKVELHISNVFAREEFRHHSLLSDVVDAALCGFGINGYTLALLGINDLLEK